MTQATSDLELGKAAEHLVAADLILQGHRAFLADQGLPYDVLVDVDGRILKVQVKATRGQRAIAQRVLTTPGYHFHVRRCGKGGRRLYADSEFDMVAFVAIDIRVIAYMAFADAVRQVIILRPPGVVPAKHAVRTGNIDQFPFDAALARVATLEATGQTFREVSDERRLAAKAA